MSGNNPEHEKTLLVEEYKELGHSWRHDDTTTSKFTAILLPVCFAGLIAPHLKNTPPKLDLVIFSYLGGAILMMFWFLFSRIQQHKLLIRFSRMYELERTLGFDSHLRFVRERSNTRGKSESLKLWITVIYMVGGAAITIVDYCLEEGIHTNIDTIPAAIVVIVAIVFIILAICFHRYIKSKGTVIRRYDYAPH